MLTLNYPTKKALKLCIGQPLRYTETSPHYIEFTRTGKCMGTNDPKRSWFANVTMKNGKISKVE